MRLGGEDDVSYDDRPLEQGIPIQRTSWLQTVDHEVEARAFLARHSADTPMVYTPKVPLGHPQTEQWQNVGEGVLFYPSKKT
jgi:hypothetical protein